MLKLNSLKVSYGGVPALRGISFEVPPRGFVAIVGPNGAGKTTLFKAISGTQPATGEISYDGVDLLKVAPAERAHMGIAHVPEGRQVFRTMTVRENLEMGGYVQGNATERARALDMILSLFPKLGERADQLAGTLSGGEQQMLAVGRGLASSPRLLMLDEPSMGLAPAIVDDIFASIAQIHRETEIAILLVEQNVKQALKIAHQGYVLENGSVSIRGSAEALLADPDVQRSYLGL